MNKDLKNIKCKKCGEKKSELSFVGEDGICVMCKRLAKKNKK